MRALGVIGLLLCSPVIAQSVDINGYSTVVVAAAGSRIDDMLGRAAADAGFKVRGTVGDVPEADRSKTLCMSVIANQRAGQRTQDVTFLVVIQDVATSTRIAACEASVPSLMGKSSFVERAAMQSTKLVVQRLGYSGFDQSAHEKNLRALGRLKDDGDPLPSPAATSAPRMRCDAGTAEPTE